MKHRAQTRVRPVICFYTMYPGRLLERRGNPCQRFLIDRQALLLRALLRRSHPALESELPDKGPHISAGVVNAKPCRDQLLNVPFDQEAYL